MESSENLVSLDRGLVENKVWKKRLDGFETGLVMRIRKRLYEDTQEAL